MKRILAAAALCLALAGPAFAQTQIPSGGGSSGVTSVTCGGTTITTTGNCGPLTGDVTAAAGSGVTTVSKIGGVSVGSAATVNVGTSGATIPLNNGNNTLSGSNTFTQAVTINQNAASPPTAITGTDLQVFSADGVAGRLVAGSFGTLANVTVARADGTGASPTQVLSGEQIGGINSYAYGSGAWQGPLVSYRSYAAENIDSTHYGSKACISTTPLASTTMADNLCVGPDGSVTLAGTSVTASSPVLSAAQTWNNSGVTFTGAKFNFTDTASNSASVLFAIQLNGANVWEQDKTVTKFGNFVSINDRVRAGDGYDLEVLNTGQIGFSSSSSAGGTKDTILTRPAAATIQHGAADVDTAPVAQTIRTQGALAGGTSNVAGANLTVIVSPGKGTGAGGSFIVQTAPAGSTGTAVNAPVTALTITSAGQATFAQDVTMKNANLGAGNNVNWSGRSKILSNSDGTLQLSNAASSSFSYLQFGGTTTSFPAIKRNGTAINIRLADDSADAPLTASNVTTSGSIIATGSAPTLTGTCTTGSQVGGNTAGAFAATCVSQTVIVTFATTAPNGWVCNFNDLTTPADSIKQTAYSTTSCTATGTTVASDVITFRAVAF